MDDRLVIQVLIIGHHNYWTKRLNIINQITNDMALISKYSTNKTWNDQNVNLIFYLSNILWLYVNIFSFKLL